MHAHKEVGETLMTDVDKVIAEGALLRIDVSNDSGCGHVLPRLHKSRGVGELEAAASVDR